MKTIRDNEGSPLQVKECYPGEIQDLYDRIHELESMLAPRCCRRSGPYMGTTSD